MNQNTNRNQSVSRRNAARNLAPFGAFSGLMDEMLNHQFWPNTGSDTLSPRVDIVDTKDSYLIKAELPGVKREDIDITVHEDVLTLKAHAKVESTAENESHTTLRQERQYGELMRQFSLRDTISQSDIVADYTDGVLTLTLPKHVPETPQPTKVEIR
jgi:HSP20 family protein